jgi:hypothetical protein
MTNSITASVFTNLDPKNSNTIQRFSTEFPVMPQIGQCVKWDGRICHICAITWMRGSTGVMELEVEINK